MGSELTEVTNVATLVGILVGLIAALTWAVPKLAAAFKGNGSGSSAKRSSGGPDPCVPCREKVDHTLLTVRDLRTELQHRDENLAVIVGQMRDALLKYLAQEEVLRQTGDGIPIPRAARGGGCSQQ